MRCHYQFFFFSFNSFYCVFFSLFLFYLGDHYHINSGIGPITLAQWDIYMNSTTHYPEETYFGAQPFGKVIGNISTHYDTFSTAEPDASLFDVGDTKYCQQGDDSQCSDATIRAALSGIKLIIKTSEASKA